MNKKKHLTKKQKLLFLFLGILIIIALLVLIIINSIPKEEPKKEPEPIKVVDSLETYGYVLHENETEYYNQLFKELKEILNRKDHTEEEYASIITQLFITDFFTLENKLTKSDIGGTQFVYETYRQDFENYAKAGMYKYIESNIYEDRTQELPTVNKVTIDTIVQSAFEYNGTSDSQAYYVDVTIEFDKDLGYKNKYQTVLIHNGEKLEISKLNKK